jgi:hypothetical protein
MVTVKIKENSKQAKLLLEYMKSLSFVEFIDSKKATVSKSKKELFLEDLEKSLREVKMIQEGKLAPLSVKDLWDEQ